MVRPAGFSAEVSPCYSAKNLSTSISKHPTPYIDIDDNDNHSTTYRHTKITTNTDKDINSEDSQKEKPHQEQQTPNTTKTKHTHRQHTQKHTPQTNHTPTTPQQPTIAHKNEYLPRYGGSAAGGTGKRGTQRRPKQEPILIQRNTKRGIRSKEKIERRKEARTNKRRKARQEHRNKKWIGKNQSKRYSHPATAEKPTEKIKIGKTFYIATLNIQGVCELGMRESVEKYMKKKRH